MKWKPNSPKQSSSKDIQLLKKCKNSIYSAHNEPQSTSDLCKKIVNSLSVNQSKIVKIAKPKSEKPHMPQNKGRNQGVALKKSCSIETFCEIQKVKISKDLRTPQNKCITTEPNVISFTAKSNNESKLLKSKNANPQKQNTESCCVTSATNSYVKSKEIRLKSAVRLKLSNFKSKMIAILTEMKQRELNLISKNKELIKENEELKEKIGLK